MSGIVYGSLERSASGIYAGTSFATGAPSMSQLASAIYGSSIASGFNLPNIEISSLERSVSAITMTASGFYDSVSSVAILASTFYSVPTSGVMTSRPNGLGS